MVNDILKKRLCSIRKHLNEISRSKFYFYEESHCKQFIATFKNFDNTLSLDLQYDIDIDKFCVCQQISKDFKEEIINDSEGAFLTYLLKNKELYECEKFIYELIVNNNGCFYDKNDKIIYNNFYQYRNYDEVQESNCLNTKAIIDKMISNITGIINSPLCFSMDHHFEDRIMDEYKRTGVLKYDCDLEVRSKKHPVYWQIPTINIHCNDYVKFNVYLSYFENLDVEDKEDKEDKEFDNYEEAFKTIKMLNEKYLKGKDNYFKDL